MASGFNKDMFESSDDDSRERQSGIYQKGYVDDDDDFSSSDAFGIDTGNYTSTSRRTPSWLLNKHTGKPNTGGRHMKQTSARSSRGRSETKGLASRGRGVSHRGRGMNFSGRLKIGTGRVGYNDPMDEETFGAPNTGGGQRKQTSARSSSGHSGIKGFTSRGRGVSHRGRGMNSSGPRSRGTGRVGYNDPVDKGTFDTPNTGGRQRNQTSATNNRGLSQAKGWTSRGWGRGINSPGRSTRGIRHHGYNGSYTEEPECRQEERRNNGTDRRQQGTPTKARSSASTNYGHEHRSREKQKDKPTVTLQAKEDDSHGRARGNQRHSVKSKPKTPPFSEDELRSLQEQNPADILERLVNSNDKSMASFSQDSLSESTILLILRVLGRLSDLDPVSAYTKELSIVLGMVETSLFLSKHLARYLVSLPTNIESVTDESCQSNDASDVGVILKVLQLFLQLKPKSYSEIGGPLILLERATSPGCLMPDLEQLKIAYNSVEQTQKSAKQLAMEKPPPNNFRDIPIFPESTEIRQVTKPFLRKNITRGRYGSVEHYLDVQFRLLREDFVAPLREGVTEFLSDTSTRPQDIRIYNNVTIEKRSMSNNGFLYTLKFDTKPLRRVRWESSKRLLYGSFICLTRDKFKHILCATVENRKPQDLEKGLFDIRFLTDAVPANAQYTMAESAAYFEASRHVLLGLQQINEHNFPFKKYIVDVSSNVDEPEYLRGDAGFVKYDLKALTGGSLLRKAERVAILSLESWPSAKDLNLDESQKAALQTALTKEFVVIQGPPGTGKTYIGLKIVEILLCNKYWISDQLPNLDEVELSILVVCYTNHALDQFLEGILAFGEENIVRVGSRSESEKLKHKNLSYLRQGRSHRSRYETRNIDRTRKQLRETDVAIQCNLLELELPTKVLLSTKALQNYMSRGEYWALSLQKKEGQYQWENKSKKLLNWLKVVEVEKTPSFSPQHYQEETQGKVRYIDVEDAGYMIERERQLDDAFDEWRMTREERRQKAEQDIFKTNAAYDISCNKRCGKFKTLFPVQELLKSDVMTDEEASEIPKIWSLPIPDRWRLYRLWVKRYVEDHEEQLRENRDKYQRLSNELQALVVGEDLEILREANVVGMTTTGAAKHRSVLQRLRPRVVMVEEAAEVLEAHIITTLTSECQHLILIGDHQQLKPNPTVYRLAKIFNLDISLFERMINNGVPCKSLTNQHRMRPEISTLMKRHFYEKLQDDESVLNMENIKGMVHNMFFIDHEHHEDEDDDNRTRSNQYEAEVLVELCRYLLRQGYKHSQITILTTYTGQLFCFRRLMDKETFGGVRVCVVDNFQGEENDIILLSLVRSNEEGSIGFLRTSNRVCVALSRARMGFYCMGNATILKEANIWQDILGTLEAQNRIGRSISLICQNHPDKITQVVTVSDFQDKTPCGGCDARCEYRLSCGHVCISLCHPYDPDHKDYNCDKPCLNKCDRNMHPCPLECYETCKPCRVQVTKFMPDCGHSIKVFCCDYDGAICSEPCPKFHDVCNHRCRRKCGESCLQICPENCEKTLQCDHPCKEICGKPCTTYCKVRVERTLSKCGHTASMDCGEVTDQHMCKKIVTKIRPQCEHAVQMPCHKDPSYVNCVERCEKTLDCGHQCPNVCGKSCEISGILSFCDKTMKQCEEIVEKSRPSCGHNVTVPCYKDPESVNCYSQCEEILPCGHRCAMKCSEQCVRDRMDDEFYYEISLKRGYDYGYFSKVCHEKCERELPCGHACPNKCGEPCPQVNPDSKKRDLRAIVTKCAEVVERKFPGCDHIVRLPCFVACGSVMCQENCNKELPCGHRCPNKCNQPCPGDPSFAKLKKGRRSKRQGQCATPRDRCDVIVRKELPCGHSAKDMPCWKAQSASNTTCRVPCKKQLECGHYCRGDCHTCHQGKQHIQCSSACNRQLLCGHSCVNKCGSICSADCKRCHETAIRSVAEESTVVSSCQHSNRHAQLKTKVCVRHCNTTLPCKHPCIGVCGEPCPPFCNVCDKRKVRANLPRGNVRDRDSYIYLSDCKHLCQMRTLDQTAASIKKSMEENFFKIRCLLCPKCKEPVRNCPRYRHLLETINEAVEVIRGKCLRNEDGKEFGRSVLPFIVGRWFRCAHGHMLYRENEHQEILCPECTQ